MYATHRSMIHIYCTCTCWHTCNHWYTSIIHIGTHLYMIHINLSCHIYVGVCVCHTCVCYTNVGVCVCHTHVGVCLACSSLIYMKTEIYRADAYTHTHTHIHTHTHTHTHTNQGNINEHEFTNIIDLSYATVLRNNTSIRTGEQYIHTY